MMNYPKHIASQIRPYATVVCVGVNGFRLCKSRRRTRKPESQVTTVMTLKTEGGCVWAGTRGSFWEHLHVIMAVGGAPTQCAPRHNLLMVLSMYYELVGLCVVFHNF